MADKLTRIAIVNHDKCKPKKCRQECKKSCPVVRMGKKCKLYITSFKNVKSEQEKKHLKSYFSTIKSYL